MEIPHKVQEGDFVTPLALYFPQLFDPLVQPKTGNGVSDTQAITNKIFNNKSAE
jgi:hypothetical protein